MSLVFINQTHSNNITTYLKAIKELDYDKAKNLASTFNAEQEKQAIQLTRLLYFAGQKKTTFDTLFPSNSSNFTKSLANLNIGYQKLYTNPYNAISFKKFNDAYNFAILDNNAELQKVCLLALLQVFDFELEPTQNLYQNYIDKLSLLATDHVDHFLIEFHKMKFIHDKVSSNQDQSLYFKLDSLQALNKQNSALNTLYYSIKSYQKELENNYDKATYFYNKILASTQNEPFLRHLKFSSYIRLAEVNRKSKNLQKAKQKIDSARLYINPLDSIRSQYYLNIYSSKINFDLGNFKEAYEENYKSSVFSLQFETNKNSKQLGQLNVLYNTAEKEKKILIEEKKKIQNRNIALGLGVLLVLGVIIFYLIQKNTKRKQYIAEQQREIEIQKTEKLLKEQELNTIDAMIEGQEKERQRLASDLHDSVGATLAAAKLQFDHLSKQINKEASTTTLVNKTAALLTEAYQEIRAMAHLKKSGVIAKNGLLPALKKLAINASNAGTLEIIVEDFGLEERLENSLEITLFRIIQELITNIIKHAQATQSTITLTQHEHEINIIVEDNGKGFIATSLQKENGMGLGSIEKRIEHIEGTMEIDSTLGKGTTIIIDIPL